MKINLLKMKCLRCKYEWQPRTDDVRQCPKCKSVKWDVPKGGK